ncbi:MAG: prolipoprotein diacylglyceryl transferase [Chloroflexi bacterium]|nr:prolipoprotein diacylglyceryl transferase [Chloroflexota bacterium]
MSPTLTLLGLTVPIFSLSLFGAALIGTAWAARRTGWPLGLTVDLALVAAAGALIGGRVEHVLLHWADWFSAHPEEIVRLSLGGLGWHGAVVGGLVGVGMFYLTPGPLSARRGE